MYKLIYVYTHMYVYMHKCTLRVGVWKPAYTGAACFAMPHSMWPAFKSSIWEKCPQGDLNVQRAPRSEHMQWLWVLRPSTWNSAKLIMSLVCFLLCVSVVCCLNYANWNCENWPCCLQSCTRKVIGRQGIGSLCKEILCFSTVPCRHIICPYLCTSDTQ